ncbi:MAG: hypothetical protein ABI673_02560 [Novosphingobium sp.]
MKVYELVNVIGEAAAVALAEAFAGTRLYVPTRMTDDHEIVLAVGRDAAERLRVHYSPTTIRIPLMRELRVLHYRKKGISHGKIATRLGMTEGGVDRLTSSLRAEGLL